MLSNFKKKRVNKSASTTLKKNVASFKTKKIEKKALIKEKKEEVSSSDSEYSDSSDSEYEEILIGNLGKAKNKDKQEEQLPPVEPLKLERLETKQVDIPNHSNHFTETKSKPIPIPKRKSKRVVIKKYYNYKPKNERKPVEKPEVKPQPSITSPEVKPVEKPKPRLNYLGFNTNNKTDDTRTHITNRIFNW